MAARSLPSPKRYAQAVYQIAAAQGNLDQWSEVLGAAAEAARSPAFVAAMDAPGLALQEKLAVLRQVLPQMLDEGYNLLALLARRRAVSLLPRVLEEYQSAVDQHHGLKRVELRTAVELTDDEERLIAERLKEAMKADVRTRTRVDPGLLGGLMVRIDDTILDGTARGRLESMRQALRARAF